MIKLRIMVICTNLTFLSSILNEWKVNNVRFKLFQPKAYPRTYFGILFAIFINFFLNIYIFLSSFRYDVIYCEWDYDARRAIRLRTGKPIFVRIHSPFSRHIKKMKLSEINRLITVSATAQNDTKTLFPSLIIPNCISDKYLELNQARNYKRNRICSVGRLKSYKRTIDSFIAVEQLRKILKVDFKFTLVAQADDLKEEAIVEKKAKENEWFTYIKWVDDLKLFYQEQDYFLCHSYYESFGVALVEAMAQGVIPLQFDFAIKHGVLPSDEYYYSNFDDLKDKISKFIKIDGEERISLANELNKFSQRYSPAIVANKILECIKSNYNN